MNKKAVLSQRWPRDAPTISFQDFQHVWSWSTNVTNRRTDDMRSQDRALRYSASRGKITIVEQKSKR